MNIPNFTRQKWVDKEGYLTDTAHQFHDQMTAQMQNNVGDEGFVIPSLSTDTINQVSNPDNNNAKPNGTIFHDETTGEMKVILNGVVKKFTVS